MLTGAGEDALPAATGLVEAVEGLITAPTAVRLERAVRAYNRLVERASAGFLLEPPREFVVSQTALWRILETVEVTSGGV